MVGIISLIVTDHLHQLQKKSFLAFQFAFLWQQLYFFNIGIPWYFFYHLYFAWNWEFGEPKIFLLKWKIRMLKNYWKLFSNKFVAEAKMQCLLEEKVASILFFLTFFSQNFLFFFPGFYEFKCSYNCGHYDCLFVRSLFSFSCSL